MIIAIIDLVIFIVGCVTISTIIVVSVVNLVDKGLDALDALILRHSVLCPPSRLETTNQIRNSRGYSKPEINDTKSLIDSHSIPYEIHKLLIAVDQGNSPFKNVREIKKQLYQKNNTEANEKSPRYLTGCPPVKHMVRILDRLKRRVNQSGKEPSQSIKSGTCWLAT